MLILLCFKAVHYAAAPFAQLSRNRAIKRNMLAYLLALNTHQFIPYLFPVYIWACISVYLLYPLWVCVSVCVCMCALSMCKQLSRVTGCRSLKRKRKLRARWQQQNGTCALPGTRGRTTVCLYVCEVWKGGEGGVERSKEGVGGLESNRSKPSGY